MMDDVKVIAWAIFDKGCEGPLHLATTEDNRDYWMKYGRNRTAEPLVRYTDHAASLAAAEARVRELEWQLAQASRVLQSALIGGEA